ncbi:MAG TPA: hypothetical protein VFX52_11575, partial [Nocardioidaceae bacterium]|nr:hypothetical protein [Nocardioidaceae bacterium]
CEACNYTKDTPGWHARAHLDDTGTPTVVTTTPTGHTYTSHPPPPPGAPPPGAPREAPRRPTRLEAYFRDLVLTA